MTTRLLLAPTLAATLLAALTAAADQSDAVLGVKLRWLAAMQSSNVDTGRDLTAKDLESGVPVLIRFATKQTPAKLAAIEEGGLVHWRRHRGKVLGSSTVHLGLASIQSLDRLAALPGVVRIELDMGLSGRPPLDETAARSGAVDLWSQRDRNGLPLDGTGVLIADLDSGVDPKHPAFFYRQTEPVAWFDDDEGGFSGGGGEWVDLNGNSSRDPDEALRFVEAVISEDFPTGNPPGFTAGLDWLYADINGDGSRNTAPEHPWGDTSPSFGEPIFVADDANGDRALDADEQLYPLGTSKIRAVRGYGGATYERGVNLTFAPIDPWAHGTPVCGILAGGEPGFVRLTGMAPGAELLVGMIQYSNSPRFWRTMPEMAAWAADEGADVLLVEDGEWVWEFMDGSSAGEVLLSELARDRGVVTVIAAGNLAGGGLHDRRSAPSGGSAVFTIEVPDISSVPSVLWLNFNWTGKRDELSWRLDGPSGSYSGAATDEPEQHELPGGHMEVTTDTSPAGTNMFAFQLTQSPHLDPGDYVFSLDSSSTQDQLIDGFCVDEYSGWSGVSRFQGSTDEGTVTWPATAHDVIVVGAYVGREVPWAQLGSLNFFSGRGTALDGRRLVDLAAPGSPTFSAAESRWGHDLGPWTGFGGTSAALPHVAGACALLLQAEPSARPSEIEQALIMGARNDLDTGAVPNSSWGYGKLDVAAARDHLRMIMYGHRDGAGPRVRPGNRH